MAPSDKSTSADMLRGSQPLDPLGDIGAIMAKTVHDLGNPLAALSTQAQLILRRARRNDPITTVIGPAECILATIKRLEALVREFTSLAREQRLDLQVVEVPPLLQALIDLWKPLATTRQIDLNIEVPQPVPPLRADAKQLRRVFDNLIKSAIEAIECGPGRITLRAIVSTAGRVRLSVEDTGPGISDAVNVFELFETTKANGTGLGLAVAKQIVLAHGGKIAHDRVMPTGTVFHVELPPHRLVMRGTDGARPDAHQLSARRSYEATGARQ